MRRGRAGYLDFSSHQRDRRRRMRAQSANHFRNSASSRGGVVLSTGLQFQRSCGGALPGDLRRSRRSCDTLLVCRTALAAGASMQPGILQSFSVHSLDILLDVARRELYEIPCGVQCLRCIHPLSSGRDDTASTVPGAF